MLTSAISNRTAETFAEEVRAGLSRQDQKELPSKYLYDPVGSALFDVICLLPEYGLTRADERLLRQHSADIVRRLPRSLRIAELGSGSGKKTRWLLQAFSRVQPVSYFPIEISRAALARCHLELSQIESVSIVGLEREYLDGLLEVTARREEDEHLLVLFLGSTIGNFDRPAAEAFLQQVRELLRSGDALLLGTDLEKPVSQLLQAYDDDLGVTASFNLNLLSRINRELEGDFDLRQFRHLARFGHEERRIEMHLLSTRAQTASIPKAGIEVEFRKDETIWTESSYKYDCDEVIRIGEGAGFTCDAQWIDAEWPFAESLLIAN
ncbi:MAG: L-histidine N(alpha)-methyltransferase [Deltaproteobacteria bacterium]